MPIALHRNLKPDTQLGIWEITESEDWFLDQLDLQAAELSQLNSIRGHRRLEWLSVRQLIHHMSGRKDRAALTKDAFGKPFLENSDFFISVSHSRDAAAAIAASGLVGIDIQQIVSKIDRLAPKFMRPEELASLRPDTRIEHLHVYWCAKEALYKAYGRRQLDFCTHLFVEPFEFETQATFRGHVRKNDVDITFSMQFEWWRDYVLVYGVEDRIEPMGKQS